MTYGYTFVPPGPFAVREMGRRETAAPAGDRAAYAGTVPGLSSGITMSRSSAAGPSS